MLAVSDSGRGKTQFISQVLDYIERCGDTAVVLDAKLELTPRFFRPKRGDKILSPKDDRCPYWHIGDEVTDYADAVSVTRAMYPLKQRSAQSDFFENQACRIGAYLLVNGNPTGAPRPTCEEFGGWLSDKKALMRRLQGTHHANTMDPQAHGQEAGLQATLNMVGDALRMMPSEREGREYFTVRNWAQSRQGWLFLPNPADIREALRPLQSMWADLTMLRLMGMGLRKDLPRVWLVYDELDSLNTLPQLNAAITEMRASGNVLVIGIQNISQLQDRYGAQAATIFSQPLSKLILATSHGESAEALSKLIGDVEIRRYKESRSGGLFGGADRNSFSGPDETRKPLVMPSEIQGLEDLEGYFIQRGKVVKIKLPYIAREEKEPAWIRREIPTDARPIDKPDSVAVERKPRLAKPTAEAYRDHVADVIPEPDSVKIPEPVLAGSRRLSAAELAELL